MNNATTSDRDQILDAILSASPRYRVDNFLLEVAEAFVDGADPSQSDDDIVAAGREHIREIDKRVFYPIYVPADFPLVTENGIETLGRELLVSVERLNSTYGGEFLHLPAHRLRLPADYPNTLAHRRALRQAIDRHVIDPLRLKPPSRGLASIPDGGSAVVLKFKSSKQR